MPAIYQAGFELQVETRPDAATEPRRLTLPQSFPPAPDLGFVGSDDALLQIDRSFDSHNIVLLYGLAGAGKSASSVEFSSWYRDTAPKAQILLFTSFEASPTISEVLAGAEPEIGIRLRGLDLTEATVQDSIILSLASKGALWVWDSVERIVAMNADNREEFTKFIRRANGSGLKFLLTARDRQENWLGDLACLVEMPTLRLSESIEFAKRILSRKGIRKFDGNIWYPLLEFAGGNPLTLRISVSSYLTTTRRPSQQMIQGYVDSLRYGTAQLGDPGGNDRTRSLTASLNYGLENAFDAHAMKILSLLSLFRTYVNSVTIWIMCHPITDKSASGMPDHDFSWNIRGLEDETHKSVERVLEKATDLGVLRKTEDNNFWLHPAIHLHLQPFFDRSYAGTEQRQIAQRAYAEAEGMFSIQFTRYLQVGGRDRVVGALTKEEANLYQALYLSRANGWWQAEVGLLHGLNALLLHQGRYEEWRMVFSSVWADFIGPDLTSLPNRQKYWSFILDHRLRIAMEDGDLDRAEPIARLIKKYEEERAEGIVRRTGSPFTQAERKRLDDLAIATGRLADVLREKEETECIEVNEEALAVYELVKNKSGIAIRHLNLGHCFKNLEAIRDLKKSEQHYRMAYDNYPENDALARAQCLAQISTVWVNRVEKKADGQPLTTELKEQLDAAVEQYEQALQMMPSDAWGDLANLHNKLASALRFDPDRQEETLDHVRKSCQYAIAVGRYYEAAAARGNLAQMFAMMRRSEEAAAAARQALAEFEAIGVTDGELIGVLERIVRRGV